MTPGGARFRDRDAVIVWAFAVLWDAAVVLLAWVVTSEHADWRGWLALTVFGLAGIGLSLFALNSALVRVDIQSGVIRITRRHPLWVRRQVLRASDVRAITTVEQSDGESTTYVCRLELRTGCPIDVLSRSRRGAAEAETARFNAALGRPAAADPVRHFR